MKKETRGDALVMRLMLKEIGDTTPFTRKEERELFLEYKKANTRRREEIKKSIINANMKFVLKYALKYKNMPMVDIREIVGEGKIGMLQAFERFDTNVNTKFITFAVWWVKSYVSKYLETTDLIRLPTHQKIKLNRARKNVDPKDFSKDIQYLNEITNAHLSIDSPMNRKEDMKLSETIMDEEAKNVETEHLKEIMKSDLLEDISKVLTNEEMLVITSVYGIGTGNPLSLRDVTTIIGKSHERARQIRDKAIRTLRKSPEIKKYKIAFGNVLSE